MNSPKKEIHTDDTSISLSNDLATIHGEFDANYWALMECDEKDDLGLTKSDVLMKAVQKFIEYRAVFLSTSDLIRFGQTNYALKRLNDVIDARTLRFERETRWIEDKEDNRRIQAELDKDLSDYFSNHGGSS